MENSGFHVSLESNSGSHHEPRSCHWITLLCIFDFNRKQKRGRLCFIRCIPCSDNGSIELARNALQVLKMIFKELTIT